MEIVKVSMQFVNFKDFYEKADTILYEFSKLSLNEKRIYKMYLYSNSFIKLKLLDKMWEYLVEPLGSFYYVSKDMLSVYL